MTPARAGNNRQNRGKINFRSGLIAEELAVFLLRLKLYRILGKRLRTPFGEVDILAQKGGALVVVEVKNRTSLADSHAAISPSQQKRLKEAGLHLSAFYGRNISSVRCDAFLFGKGGFPRHIKNAFQD
jgi:putative endonuclease